MHRVYPLYRSDVLSARVPGCCDVGTHPSVCSVSLVRLTLSSQECGDTRWADACCGSIDYLGSQNFPSWNQLDGWLRQVEGLRRVA
jgi:hypothetical protein